MIKYFILAVLFLSSLNTKADDFQFIRRENHIFLRSVTCDTAKYFAKNLFQWTFNLHEQNSCNFKSLNTVLSEGQCELDVSGCVPDIVGKYLGVYLDKGGPNCFNEALVASKILSSLRYSGIDELNFYLSSPLCRSVEKSAPKKAGDIGVIREFILNGDLLSDPEHGVLTPVHAFTYISDQMAFQKGGATSGVPYTIDSLRKILDLWGVPDKGVCRSQIPKAGCYGSVAFYRCKK